MSFIYNASRFPGGTISLEYLEANYFTNTSCRNRFVPYTGGTLTGPLYASSETPTSATELCTKSYADLIASGQLWKNGCIAVSDANIDCTYDNADNGVGATLTANADGTLSIDGVSPASGDRVLITGQTTPHANGIYVVTDAGQEDAPFVLTRASDADGTPSNELELAATTIIDRGDLYAGTIWVLSAAVTTVGIDAVTFTQSKPLNSIPLGNGLVKANNQLSTSITANLVYNGGAIDLPQSIMTSSSPTFSALTINNGIAAASVNASSGFTGQLLTATQSNVTSLPALTNLNGITVSSGTLGAFTVAGDITPSGSRDIGASGNRFANVYGTTGDFTSLTTGSFTVGSLASTGNVSINYDTNPAYLIKNSSGTIEYTSLGRASGSGAYSSDAGLNDSVLRSYSNNLLLQSGTGKAAFKINTSNNITLGGSITPRDNLQYNLGTETRSFNNVYSKYYNGEFFNIGIAGDAELEQTLTVKNTLYLPAPAGHTFSGGGQCLSLFGTTGGYAIGFDSLSGTVGYIRHNISASGTNTWGHVFSHSSGVSGPYTTILFAGASGNVGVGTVTPSEKLTVASGNVLLSSGYSVYVGGKTDSGSNGVRLHYGTNDAYIDTKGSGSLWFRLDNSIGSSDIMSVSSSGLTMGSGKKILGAQQPGWVYSGDESKVTTVVDSGGSASTWTRIGFTTLVRNVGVTYSSNVATIPTSGLWCIYANVGSPSTGSMYGSAVCIMVNSAVHVKASYHVHEGRAEYSAGQVSCIIALSAGDQVSIGATTYAGSTTVAGYRFAGYYLGSQ